MIRMAPIGSGCSPPASRACKGTYTFTSQLFVRGIAQYVSTRPRPVALPRSRRRGDRGDFSGSLLLAYKLNWQSVMFVGYGDDRELTEPATRARAARPAVLRQAVLRASTLTYASPHTYGRHRYRLTRRRSRAAGRHTAAPDGRLHAAPSREGALFAKSLKTGATVAIDPDDAGEHGVGDQGRDHARGDVSGESRARVSFDDTLHLRKEDQVSGSGVLLLFHRAVRHQLRIRARDDDHAERQHRDEPRARARRPRKRQSAAAHARIQADDEHPADLAADGRRSSRRS